MKKLFLRLVWASLCLAATLITTAPAAFAQQETIHFQLIDAEWNQPIQDVLFQYGDVQGVTSGDGKITIHFKKGEFLWISHLSYGEHVFSDAHLLAASETGVLKIRQAMQRLQPVTVISVRPHRAEAEIMKVEQNDHLMHDAGSLLERIPAVSGIRKSGGYGADPVLRGFKYEQLNIIIDGLAAPLAACPSRMDPPTSQIALNMMESVEVMKGPHALRYGNTIGGTINFVSKQPDFRSGLTTSGRFSAGHETNGGAVRTEGALQVSGSRIVAEVFGSLSESGNYQAGNGMRVHAGYSRGSIGSEISFKLTDDQRLKVSATRNIARNVDFAALGMDLRSDDTWMFHANHTIRFGETGRHTWTTSVNGSYVDHVMDNLSREHRMMDMVAPTETKGVSGRTEGRFEFGRQLVYTGADFSWEEARGKSAAAAEPDNGHGNGHGGHNQVYDGHGGMGGHGMDHSSNSWQNGNVTSAGLFAEMHRVAGSLRWVASARLDVNHAGVGEPNARFMHMYPDVTRTDLNPGISLGVHKALVSGWELGVWAGRAQRSGSILERYIFFMPVGADPYEIVGNPNVKPEANHQIDVIISHTTPRWMTELSLFASDVRNMITGEIRHDLMPRQASSPGVRQITNIGHAFLTGAEWQMQTQLPGNLTAGMSLAYTFGKDVNTGDALPEISPLDSRITLRGRFLDGKLTPHAQLRHVVRQSRVSASYGETQTPSFTRVDLGLKYHITRSVYFSAEAQNVLDANYYEHLSRAMRTADGPIFAPGRNIVLMVGAQF